MKYQYLKVAKKRKRTIHFLLLVFFAVFIGSGCRVNEEDGISVLEEFERLHDQLSTRYAFTDWKSIDWNAKYQLYQPQIAAAEASNNSSDYYYLLREYVHSIPDSHVALFPSNDAGADLFREVRFQHIGGSYGFVLIGLNDGRIVVALLSENGPAAQAGIEFGAEIIEWNGQPIDDALAQVPLLWAASGLATNEMRKIFRWLFLGRAPVNTSAAVTFLNPESVNQTKASSVPVTVELTAVEDNYLTIDRFYDFYRWGTGAPAVQYQMLPQGYGYLKVTREAEETIPPLEEALRFFISNHVSGIIVDLRENYGGEDQIAADICGYFYNERTHYEHVYGFNPSTGEFERELTIEIVPRSPYFGGRIIAMVGPFCASSGEGPAKYIQKLSRGKVVGFFASNGSFGMSGGEKSMPLGLTVLFTHGQSRDENHVIQIDANAQGIGGVVPDFRVPLNMDNLRAVVVENRDIELEYAIERMGSLLIRPANE